MRRIQRREFLKASATLAAGSELGLARLAQAMPMEVPEVDNLSVRVLIDSSHDLFFRPGKVNGVSIQPMGKPDDFRRILHNQWGLSLYIESQRAEDRKAFMLDYGYSPDALLNNIELVKMDPAKVSALIVSHGHYDHFGGLVGFLDRYRDRLPPELRLYAGGEDNFCHRVQRSGDQQYSDFGTLDRRELAAHKVSTVLCETPTIIEGHAFTTGKIRRSSMEKILPNTYVEFKMTEGLGCNAGHYLPAEMEGRIVPDEHIHEHATCFNLKGKGLVVISSCGHVGIVNSVRQAMEVSGIQKVHAIVGGFHLGPAPADYVGQVVAEMKKLDPDAVIPMHCSGANFVQAAREQMPDRLLVSTTGSLITFGA